MAPHPTPTRQPSSELQRLLDTYRDYYNTRRHSALPRRNPTPGLGHRGQPSADQPTCPSRPTPPCTAAPSPDTGTIGVGKHRISVGRAYDGTTLTAIRDGNHATVYNTDGHPIGHAYLDPDKNYVPLTPDPRSNKV